MEEIYLMPQTTLEEFRGVYDWVDQIVSKFWLMVKCTRTGHPAVLRAHGSGESGPRFVFSYYDPEKKSYIATHQARVLPHLTLTISGDERQRPSSRGR